MKRCANCEEFLPYEYFTNDVRRPDGRCPYCKVCAQMRQFLKYRRHRLGYLAKNKEYAQLHPEVNWTARKKYRETHREQRRVAWLARTTEQRHEEYLRLRDATIERARKWRADHPGATTIQGRIWRENNPEKARALSVLNAGRRKDRINGNGFVRFGAEELKALLERQKNRCFYCNVEFDAADINRRVEFDHMVPLKRGGVHAIGNICAACRKCNRAKRCLTAEEYVATL